MKSHELQSVLTRAGVVSAEQVERAVAATAGGDSTWLEHLVQQKLVCEEAVAQHAGRAAFVPLCELDRLAAVPREVLAEMPFDLAIEYRAVPLAVEADGDLRVAMVDPCDERGNVELQFFLGRRLLREVAPVTAMAWALSSYYGARAVMWPSAQMQRMHNQSRPGILRPNTGRMPAERPQRSRPDLRPIMVGS